MKECIKCNTVKDLSRFQKRSDNGKYRGECKDCASEFRRINKVQRGEEYRKTRWMKKYNITSEQYDKAIQIEHCECCNKKLQKRNSNGYGKDLAVFDHCHQSGEFRGVICSECNLVLGQFKDDISRFLKAIEYLSK